MNQQLDNEDMIRERRRRRMQEMQRQKKRQMQMRKAFRTYAPLVGGILILCFIVFTGYKVFRITSGLKNHTQIEQSDNSVIDQTAGLAVINEEGDSIDESGQKEEFPEDNKVQKVYSATATDDTIQPGEDVISKHVIFIDLSNDTILAQRASSTIINPASMTKILTLLVAAENISEENLEDTFTITIEITDYSYRNDCSNVGFDVGETVTVRDLLYGTILPSGGDAALGLATYVAGSQEAFVTMMNDKLEDLGLSRTAHFTNCIGLYDKEHYCTVYDMAMILEAAIENELCREVMSAHTYTTSNTQEHPEGITISNWFLRRIEDKDTGGEVVCGKTGYVVQSGNCAASYGIDNAGKGYICVTADSTSSWRCIYDHVALYRQFSTGNDNADMDGEQ